jgi:hypothetical protein
MVTFMKSPTYPPYFRNRITQKSLAPAGNRLGLPARSIVTTQTTLLQLKNMELSAQDRQPTLLGAWIRMVSDLYILYNKRDATYTMFFIIIGALHVSGTVQLKLNSSNPSTPVVDSRKA